MIEAVTTPELTSYPMFIAFDEVGNLFIAESTGKDISGKEMRDAPECQILRLVDSDGDGTFDSRTVFAESLSLPMGVLWHQGSLFVASPPEFLRFDDTDDNGVADVRTVLHTGWNVLNTASLHGPFLGPDGRLYLTHGRHGYNIMTQEGQRLQGLASRIWRSWPDGSQLERFAGGGFDNPIELVFLPNGDMIGTMTYFTDPKFGQRDALMHFVRGGVYPKPHGSTNEFIQTGPDLMPVMSKFARIAPSGLERYEGDAFGGEYQGALFSAQFNPHRIQSHRLIPEGASYRTEDADFLTSSDPNFYPTDVLQDADGSLLISDTGAWYVDACPVSRIAKPEVKGAIYRISRTDAHYTDDPWGQSISWETLSDADASSLLADKRIMVRKRALAKLIATEAKALPYLSDLLTSTNDRTRQLALTAVRQIDSPARLEILSDALNDESPAIRMSAIQALGELGHTAAAESIAAHLSGDSPAERRLAAKALGQIGDPKSIPSLLRATERTDRFVQHAITYALIEINDGDALYTSISEEDQDLDAGYVVGLIALDQLGDKRVSANHVLPLITSENQEWVNTGLWIASQHEEFAPDVMSFLRTELIRPDFKASENIQRALLSYASLSTLQNMLAELLVNDDVPIETTLFAFDTLAKALLPELPTIWNEAIRNRLTASNNGHAELRWAALDLVVSKSLDEFDDLLLEIGRDDSETQALRLSALSGVGPRLDPLPDTDFGYASSVLSSNDSPTLKQSAARVLSVSRLSRDQKATIARELMSSADSMLLTALLTIFKGETDSELGRTLVSALKTNESTTEFLTEQQISSALANFPETIQQAAKPLFTAMQDRNDENIERFIELEAQLGTGDVGRGRRIFFGEAAACSSCHAIGAEGGDFGPDLTTIGEVRTGHDLLEAIMFPNSSFVPEFAPYVVETAKDVHMGLIERETDSGITLRIDPDARTFVPRSEITAMNASTLSLMPEGLDAGLSDAELIDLITFLQTLNGNAFLEVAQH